jgi:plasmid maintenance system antidote protein VapI
MLDIFKSYLRDEDFYIIITKNGLLINNFNKIVNLDKNTLSILINNKKYIFKGNNFKIIRSIDKSLELESNIESVNIE